MNILFVCPNLAKEEYISLSIGYLSAYIKRAGHKVDLVDYTFGGDINDCIKKVQEFNPELVCFSLRSNEYNFCLKIAKSVKSRFDVKTVFGGAHPTVDPENTIKNKSVDMICIGEGEEALLELIEKMERGEDFTNTHNFWFKKDGQVIKNSLRHLVENLDILPFPDREIFDFKQYLECRNGAMDMIIGRGCPFGCTYCINHILQKLYDGLGRYVRLRSVDNVLDEIRQITSKYDIKTIRFNDDLFTIDKDWVKEFSEKYSKEFKIPFYCNARTELITDELCEDLKNAGCVSLNMGIESGSEKLRREVLNRQNSNENIINAFKIAKKHGLSTFSYNMVGLPFETLDNISESIDLNQKVNPDFLTVSIFQPLPGTKLAEICKENGWIEQAGMTTTIRKHSILNYPDISAKEIKKQQTFFRYKVLKKENIKKAFVTLLYDLNENVYRKVRDRMPRSIKKLIIKVNLSFRSKELNKEFRKKD